MNKTDVCLILGVLLLAGALWLLWPSGVDEDALTAEIYVAGELKERIPLPAQATELEIEGMDGWNRVLLEPDGVRVIDADCANLDCVHSGKLTAAGWVIACLPHRVLIRLAGRPDGEVDAVAR